MMRTNTDIYLSSGAILQIIPGSVEYEAIEFTNTSNARIGGRGMLDAATSAEHAIVIKESRDFTIEGLTILAPQGTAIRFQNSEYGSVDNSNILVDPNDLADGIDIDSSQNINVNNVFVHSTDDNITLGQTQVSAIQTIENVKITNSVFYNKLTGADIKICPWMIDATGYLVRNVFIGNDYMISGANYSVGIYALAGLSIDHIYFSNIWYEQTPDRIFEVHIEGPFWNGVPWSGQYGTISNIHINNFQAYSYGGQMS
jgi:hypothetical protein